MEEAKETVVKRSNSNFRCKAPQTHYAGKHPQKNLENRHTAPSFDCMCPPESTPTMSHCDVPNRPALVCQTTRARNGRCLSKWHAEAGANKERPGKHLTHHLRNAQFGPEKPGKQAHLLPMPQVPCPLHMPGHAPCAPARQQSTKHKHA